MRSLTSQIFSWPPFFFRVWKAETRMPRPVEFTQLTFERFSSTSTQPLATSVLISVWNFSWSGPPMILPDS